MQEGLSILYKNLIWGSTVTIIMYENAAKATTTAYKCEKRELLESKTSIKWITSF